MSNRISKYHILKTEILNKIDSGDYQEGQMIESERELTELFHFSRITVRKAIDELVNEGILYRVHGKGTFVKKKKNGQLLFKLIRCVGDTELFDSQLTKAKSTTKFLADVSCANNLQIPAHSIIYRIDFLEYMDEEPLCYIISYLPEKLFPELDNCDLEKKSLYDILKTDYNVQITKIERTVEAVFPEPIVVNCLHVHDNMPVICFECITYGIVMDKEIPIETFKCYCRTDKYKLYID